MATTSPRIVQSEPQQDRSEWIHSSHGAPSQTGRRSGWRSHHHPRQFRRGKPPRPISGQIEPQRYRSDPGQGPSTSARHGLRQLSAPLLPPDATLHTSAPTRRCRTSAALGAAVLEHLQGEQIQPRRPFPLPCSSHPAATPPRISSRGRVPPLRPHAHP